MAPDELKTRARRVVEEFLNRGDLAVANELISPDCLHHIPGGQSVPGLAALRDFLALTLSIFPDFHAIVEDEIAEDDRVVQRIACYGTHEGEFACCASSRRQQNPAGRQLTDPHLLKGNPMATDVQTRSLSGLTGARRGALLAYRWLLLAFLLAGGVQIFLAGLGVFSVTGHGASADSAFSAHRGLGFAMGGAAVIILVLALLARPGVLPLTLAGVLVVQTFLLQSLLAGLADNAALYGGLHALDGLLALANAGFLYASARRWRA